MTTRKVTKIREALANLPVTNFSETLKAAKVANVYLPPAHLKALNPDIQLVTGMRGAGKTFWWKALQQASIRQFIHKIEPSTSLNKSTKVRIGFGVSSEPDECPDMDVLRLLIENERKPREIWRTVQVWQIAKEENHPLCQESNWDARVAYVRNNPEQVGRLLKKYDSKLDQEQCDFLIIFDALDRCAEDWKIMYDLIQGLMQTALDMLSYRRLRIKIFLRSDQVDESRIANFPDASKILASSVDLSWPSHELYNLLWHLLVNGKNGDYFRKFLGTKTWRSMLLDRRKVIYHILRSSISSGEEQREKFHEITGPWMGTDRKRGFPYTWIPNHLADTDGRVSPRSFLRALRVAAENTEQHYPNHNFALHYESTKRGIQSASKVRVDEIREDYPWVHGVLEVLQGIVVPCKFKEINKRWKEKQVLENLIKSMKEDEVKLPPLHIKDGAEGVRADLEELKVFSRLVDGRVNIPDVFRVGYGLGRRGGVKPALTEDPA